jgi:hypothetical protein
MRRHFPASGETQERQPNRWLKPLMAVPFLTAAFVMFAWPDPTVKLWGVAVLFVPAWLFVSSAADAMKAKQQQNAEQVKSWWKS